MWLAATAVTWQLIVATAGFRAWIGTDALGADCVSTFALSMGVSK
jgi:hypothetical protein